MKYETHLSPATSCHLYHEAWMPVIKCSLKPSAHEVYSEVMFQLITKNTLTFSGHFSYNSMVLHSALRPGLPAHTAVFPPGMFWCSLLSHRAVKPEGKQGSVRLRGGIIVKHTLHCRSTATHMEAASRCEDFLSVFQVGKSFI